MVQPVGTPASETVMRGVFKPRGRGRGSSKDAVEE